jgi:hypothetical protein
LGLLYLAAALLLADQVADLAATVLAKPLSVSLATWRFGVFGLLMTRVSVFLIADVVLFAAALGLAHRGVLRSLGVIHVLLAVLLLAGLGIFALDWLQVRKDVPAEAARSVNLAGARAVGMGLLACLLAVWGGVATLRATRQGRSGRRDVSTAPLLASQGDQETPP